MFIIAECVKLQKQEAHLSCVSLLYIIDLGDTFIQTSLWVKGIEEKRGFSFALNEFVIGF